MRPVLVNSGGKVEVETVPDPTLPGPQGAVVAAAAAPICGSDLHFFDGLFTHSLLLEQAADAYAQGGCPDRGLHQDHG
jgi:threonine dehydrogenase-like Zn-dependent dehydrogenase